MRSLGRTENVRVIIEKVPPSLTPQDQHGNSLTVPQIVCLSLEQMAGGHFQRTQGDLLGVGTSTRKQIHIQLL